MTHQQMINANHPLPAGLTSVGGSLYLNGYKRPLPAGLTSVGSLDLNGYKHPLPAGLTGVGGYLYLGDYEHPLPAGLTSVGGYLYLGDYKHPLPAGLTSVGGSLYLGDYKHPLPAGLTSVGGSLYLRDYKRPLPAGLTSVGGSLYLRDYKQPLPAGLTSAIKADLFEVLAYEPEGVPGLLDAIRGGRIDGSTYTGACKCLVGTLERAGKSLPHNPSRPAEKWFVPIRIGDTPSTNRNAALAAEWVEEYLATHAAVPERKQ